MSYLDSIEKRHAERSTVITESRKIKPPVLTDDESVKAHLKLIKEQQGALINACFLVDRDMQTLLVALTDLAHAAGLAELKEEYVQFAWQKLRLTDEEQEVLNRRDTEAAEAREKEAKARGEVPGQMKLVHKDDGSIAEPASAVTTKKLQEGA